MVEAAERIACPVSQNPAVGVVHHFAEAAVVAVPYHQGVSTVGVGHDLACNVHFILLSFVCRT